MKVKYRDDLPWVDEEIIWELGMIAGTGEYAKECEEKLRKFDPERAEEILNILCRYQPKNK